MRIGHRAHDRQPQTEAPTVIAEPTEPIEDPLTLRLRNARAVVIDDQADRTSLILERADMHLAPLRGVADRIGHQIAQHRLHGHAPADHLPRLDIQLQFGLTAVRLEGHVIDDINSHAFEIDLGHLGQLGRTLGTGQRQQLIDEMRAAVDVLQQIAQCFGPDCVVSGAGGDLGVEP